MKTPGRASGVSLSKELSSLAEFRLFTAEKLQLIERLISGNSTAGAEPVKSAKAGSTKHFGFDHDPEVTRFCLQLLVASGCPLTIGQICAELQSKPNVTMLSLAKSNGDTEETSRKPTTSRESAIMLCEDVLSLVSKSLHQLTNLMLAVPVERGGIRKWVWAGNDVLSNEKAPLANGKL